MSNPLINEELPELPLGQPLRVHLTTYMVHMIMAMDLCIQKGDYAEQARRTLSSVYEDLSGILEFHSREIELECGFDRLLFQVNACRDTAYMTIERNGETCHEIPMDKRAVAEFIATMQAEHARMVGES